MGAIVENDMLKVFQIQLADGGHGAHVHNRGSVPVERPNISASFGVSNAQSNRAGMAHASDAVEIAFVVDLHFLPQFRELPGEKSGCGFRKKEKTYRQQRRVFRRA
jgi:hypothetical protein